MVSLESMYELVRKGTNAGSETPEELWIKLLFVDNEYFGTFAFDGIWWIKTVSSLFLVGISYFGVMIVSVFVVIVEGLRSVIVLVIGKLFFDSCGIDKAGVVDNTEVIDDETFGTN